MKYKDLLNAHKKYGTTKEDILKREDFDQVLEKVVIAPWWNADIFENIAEITKINSKVYNIKINKLNFTFLQLKATGASAIIEDVLALGVSKCKKLIFIGSVGSLDESIKIGDIVIPGSSICGDGASRYLNADLTDEFGKEHSPNSGLQKKLIKVTKTICKDNKINFHIVKNFSVDSVFAQFPYIDYIKSLECKTIEMETATLFKASKIANIKAVAIFCVSDNTIIKKSLYSGVTEKENNYRRYIRRQIIPLIIENVFKKTY